jgi:hypothetical protein
MGEDKKMDARNEFGAEQFVRITAAIWWLSVSEPEAIALLAPTNTEATKQTTNEHEFEPEPEQAQATATTQIGVTPPTQPPDPTDIAITLLMTATYTIRLFDALLAAYPGLRADMQDELDKFAEFVNSKAIEWTGEGIFEPSVWEEEE